jgi:hypothetical protein
MCSGMWGTILPIFTHYCTFSSYADAAQGGLRKVAFYNFSNGTILSQGTHRNAFRTLERIYVVLELDMSCPRTCYWVGMEPRDKCGGGGISVGVRNLNFSLRNSARWIVKQYNQEHSFFCKISRSGSYSTSFCNYSVKTAVRSCNSGYDAGAGCVT